MLGNSAEENRVASLEKMRKARENTRKHQTKNLLTPVAIAIAMRLLRVQFPTPFT